MFITKDKSSFTGKYYFEVSRNVGDRSLRVFQLFFCALRAGKLRENVFFFNIPLSKGIRCFLGSYKWGLVFVIRGKKSTLLIFLAGFSWFTEISVSKINLEINSVAIIKSLSLGTDQTQKNIHWCSLKCWIQKWSPKF